MLRCLFNSSLTVSSYLKAPVCRECRLMGRHNVAALEAVCFPSSFSFSCLRTRDCRLSAVAVFHSTPVIEVDALINPRPAMLSNAPPIRTRPLNTFIPQELQALILSRPGQRTNPRFKGEVYSIHFVPKTDSIASFGRLLYILP